jgi:hypothetical protein
MSKRFYLPPPKVPLEITTDNVKYNVYYLDNRYHKIPEDYEDIMQKYFERKAFFIYLYFTENETTYFTNDPTYELKDKEDRFVFYFPDKVKYRDINVPKNTRFTDYKLEEQMNINKFYLFEELNTETNISETKTPLIPPSKNSAVPTTPAAAHFEWYPYYYIGIQSLGIESCKIIKIPRGISLVKENTYNKKKDVYYFFNDGTEQYIKLDNDELFLVLCKNKSGGYDIYHM